MKSASGLVPVMLLVVLMLVQLSLINADQDSGSVIPAESKILLLFLIF